MTIVLRPFLVLVFKLMTQNAKKDASGRGSGGGSGSPGQKGVNLQPGSSVRPVAWSGLSFAFEEIINDLVFATVAKAQGSTRRAAVAACRRGVTPLRAGH